MKRSDAELQYIVAKPRLEQAAQRHMDTEVHATRGYDSVLHAISYANSTDPTFAADALVAIAWRDAVWNYCIAELAKFEAGTRTDIPTDAEFIAELPALVW